MGCLWQILQQNKKFATCNNTTTLTKYFGGMLKQSVLYMVDFEKQENFLQFARLCTPKTYFDSCRKKSRLTIPMSKASEIPLAPRVEGPVVGNRSRVSISGGYKHDDFAGERSQNLFRNFLRDGVAVPELAVVP